LVKTELKKFGVTNGTKFGEGEIIGKTKKKEKKITDRVLIRRQP
jgi:hypothetical protein